MMTSEKRKKQRRKFRRFWTKRELQTDMYKRLTKEYDYDFLVEQAEEMEAWAAKKGRLPSLLRFNRWLKNRKKWDQEKDQEAVDWEGIEKEERETARRLHESK